MQLIKTAWTSHLYYVTEDTARRVKQNLGLDLKTGRYQSGADVVVVSDEEGDNGD
jgi:hypothetical protein